MPSAAYARTWFTWTPQSATQSRGRAIQGANDHPTTITPSPERSPLTARSAQPCDQLALWVAQRIQAGPCTTATSVFPRGPTLLARDKEDETSPPSPSQQRACMIPGPLHSFPEAPHIYFWGGQHWLSRQMAQRCLAAWGSNRSGDQKAMSITLNCKFKMYLQKTNPSIPDHSLAPGSFSCFRKLPLAFHRPSASFPPRSLGRSPHELCAPGPARPWGRPRNLGQSPKNGLPAPPRAGLREVSDPWGPALLRWRRRAVSVTAKMLQKPPAVSYSPGIPGSRPRRMSLRSLLFVFGGAAGAPQVLAERVCLG